MFQAGAFHIATVKNVTLQNDPWYKTVHDSCKLVHVTKRYTVTKQYVAEQYINITAQYQYGLVGCSA